MCRRSTLFVLDTVVAPLYLKFVLGFVKLGSYRYSSSNAGSWQPGVRIRTEKEAMLAFLCSTVRAVWCVHVVFCSFSGMIHVPETLQQ